MKNVISITFLLIATALCAQVNQTDSKGRKQGPWQKIYPGTKVFIYKGQFKDDKPVGKFVYYYKSSKVKAIIKHDEGSNRSEAYYYHETGVLMSHGIYRDMKKDSIWVNFGPSGRLSSKETYKDDALNGQTVIFYIPEDLNDKSQRPSILYNYVNGKLEGECKEFFESGKLKKQGTYHENKKVGIWTDYHTNGNKASEIRYKNGVKHGWAYVYNKSGNRTDQVYFYNGRRLEGEELKEKLRQMKELGISPNG